MTQLHAPEASNVDNVVELNQPGHQAGRTSLGTASPAEALVAATHASRLVPPLWPLESFVAVNPFLGLSNQPFADAEATVERIWGGRLMMPRSFYARALRSARIGDQDIDEAIAELGDKRTRGLSAALVRQLAEVDGDEPQPAATFADAAAAATGTDWGRLVVERVSLWAAGHFDEGQAAWQSPWREEAPYAAWKAQAEIDRTIDLGGLTGFREHVRGLPDEPGELLARVAQTLELTPDDLAVYFPRLLATVGGWAGHARYKGWQAELDGDSDDTVQQLLAIRAAWDLALFECLVSTSARMRWHDLRRGLTAPADDDKLADRTVTRILHTAYEIAGRRHFLEAVKAPATEPSAQRASAQAVFCIDVRSERYRRMLEKVNPRIETLGFAGFFGFAIEVAEIDQEAGGAQCPVLLKPQFLVRESLASGNDEQNAAAARGRTASRAVAGAWKAFSNAAVSSFAFVEAMGLMFGWKLILDAFGIKPRRATSALAPSIDAGKVGVRMGGISLEERVAVARRALHGMSLTSNFAPLVALIGHGSTSANNPYASRLNCGACGGHTGEANARVAAQVLNDADVRAALIDEGLTVPADTLFVAGLHDTATDEVHILGGDSVPQSHKRALTELMSQLKVAGRLAREERAESFGIDRSRMLDADIMRRTRDWSEVRPEWGLAGCAAFIAAPRARTELAHLDGRSFLHSYDWRADDNFEVLELIVTAPLMVATWISLQYYASTVDNERFGSGEKTLHNVVGGVGVLEGNGGDLRVGLPHQSLHDGFRFVHEPMRLNAIIEAPTEALTGLLIKHKQVRELVDNGWIHLFAIMNDGKSVHRYLGDLKWSDELGTPAPTDLWKSSVG